MVRGEEARAMEGAARAMERGEEARAMERGEEARAMEGAARERGAEVRVRPRGQRDMCWEVSPRSIAS